MEIPKEKIIWTELESGLRVVTVEMPNFYTIAAGLFASVGSRYEHEDEMGISHFIEHLLFKGSKKFSAKKISEIIEGRGGFLNAYTSEESTCFYFKTLPNSFFESLDVLVDLYTDPLFDPIEIEKEKDVVIEELHSYEDQPSAYIDDLFGATIWKNHPLGNLILGKKETVLKHNYDKISAYFNKYYNASNSVLAVAGCITHEEVLAWIKNEQHRFKKGNLGTFKPFQIIQTKASLTIYTKDLEQCNLQFGVPTPGRYSEEQWALRVLNTIIGENMSSRLFQEIRENRGLAYHISSAVDFYDDVGSFSIQCGVDQDNVEECIKQSLAILHETVFDSITPEELKRAKAYGIGQALQDMESTLSYMLFVGDKLLSKERDFSTFHYCEKLGAVTLNQVGDAASKIFKNSLLNLALIGPYNHKDKLIKQLLFGN